MKNQIVWAFSLCLLSITACKPAAVKEEGDSTMKSDTTKSEMAPAEFADAKYTDIVRNGMAAFEKGDLATWLNNYSDNAVYAWNSGDSLAGKAAINAYWTKRWADVIDSLSFTNEIYLPVKVNKPQSIEAPGVWVLTWYQVNAKYKTSGKSMTQWMHSDSHFDANDKIDRFIIYNDRAVINAAMAK